MGDGRDRDVEPSLFPTAFRDTFHVEAARLECPAKFVAFEGNRIDDIGGVVDVLDDLAESCDTFLLGNRLSCRLHASVLGCHDVSRRSSIDEWAVRRGFIEFDEMENGVDSKTEERKQKLLIKANAKTRVHISITNFQLETCR